MISFPFTRKKFTALSPAGQHRHTVAWLTDIFQSLRTGRVAPAPWQAFLKEYARVLDWMNLPLPATPPEPGRTPEQLAWVSDAIQRHRTGAGMVVRDPDLAATMITGDRVRPLAPPRGMDYQVALDGLRSLFNIGSIYRTCEAAGITTVILGSCPGKADPRVRKTAMGTHRRISEEIPEDLAGHLETKREKGFVVIGVETVEGSVPCHEFAWPARAVLVFGNEEYGISPHVLAAADHFVHLPMFGTKNSLNVASAASAILFQAVFSLTWSGPD